MAIWYCLLKTNDWTTNICEYKNEVSFTFWAQQGIIGTEYPDDGKYGKECERDDTIEIYLNTRLSGRRACWASGVYLSPSIKYVSHSTYGELVTLDLKKAMNKNEW